MPKNDPALWSVAGIEEALDEAEGEMGIAVNYGWVRIGRAHSRYYHRELDPLSDMADVRTTTDGSVELWATITLDEKDVVEFLRADAEQHLAKDTRYEIRRKYPTNYGRTKGMAWYHNAAMAKREIWGLRPTKLERRDGYMLVGEYVTGEKT